MENLDVTLNPDDETTEDRIREVCADLMERADDIREAHGVGAEACQHIADLTAELDRAYWPAAVLGDLDGYDVAGIIARVTAMPERGQLHGYRIDVVWRRKHGTRNRRAVDATCGPTSRRDRECGAAPFRLTLALDRWVLRTPEERERLVHHELGHCGVDVDETGRVTFNAVAHDDEEFAATVARYGVEGEGAARIVGEAMAHPATAARLREYGVDPATGQGLLFVGGAVLRVVGT